MHQIKEEIMQGLFILHIELNPTQTNRWAQSLWQANIQPIRFFDFPSGCILHCSLKLPSKKLMLKLQSLGFDQGIIELDKWFSLETQNLWLLRSKFTLDQEWLIYCLDLISEWDTLNQPILLPSWLNRLFEPLNKTANHENTIGYGIEGIFQLKEGVTDPLGFLNPKHISTNMFTKPVLKVSYVNWSAGKNPGIPGAMFCSTGLTLPLHQK